MDAIYAYVRTHAYARALLTLSGTALWNLAVPLPAVPLAIAAVCGVAIPELASRSERFRRYGLVVAAAMVVATLTTFNALR